MRNPFFTTPPFSMQGNPFSQPGNVFAQQNMGGPYFDFRDEFDTVLASAQLNGSPCTPGPGTRTVTDTETCMSIIPNYGSSLADQTGVTFGGSNNRCSYADGYAWADFPTGFNFAAHAGLGRIVVMYDSAGRAAWGFIGAAGTGETLGSEKLPNGGFDTSSNWTLSNCSIGSGVLSFSGTAGNAYQTSLNLGYNKLYVLTYNITAYTTGNFYARINSSTTFDAVFSYRTAIGNYTEYKVSPQDTTNVFVILASVIPTGSLDNYSLKQVLTPSSTGALIYRDAACTVNGWHKPAAFNMNDTAYTFNIYQPTSGGRLFIQGGKATPAYGDPGLWDGEAITRAAGLICAFKVNPKDISKVIGVGLDTDKTGALAANALRVSSSTVIPYNSGSAGPVISIPTNSTEHILAIILRAAGAKYFMKSGSGYYKKLWEAATNNTATLYRGISNYSLTGKVDFLRQSKTLWMDTPLLSDSFTGSSGTNDGRVSDGAGHAEGITTIPMVGDSFVAGVYTSFNLIGGGINLSNNGTSGYTLSQIQTALAPVISGKNSVIIEGGINDLAGSDSSTVASMQSTMSAMISTCASAGVKPVILNIGPWKNNEYWTSDRQEYTEDYNSWLSSYCSSNSLLMLDIYTLLKTDGDDTINALYDNGDHLHPNTAGYTVIANALSVLIPRTTPYIQSVLGSGGFATWSGATGYVSNGRLAITPTYTAKIINGDMEGTYVFGVAPSWLKNGSDVTLSENNVDFVSGIASQKITTNVTVGNGISSSAFTISKIGAWCKMSGYFKGNGTSMLLKRGMAGSLPSSFSIAIGNNANWTKKQYISKSTGTGSEAILVVSNSTTPTEISCDLIGLDELNDASCFAIYPNLTSKDITIRTAFQMQSFLQAGVVLGLNDAGTSFILAYHDGNGNIKCEINEAGTYTTKATVAAAYSSDAELVVRRDNKEIWVWYNNTLIGSGPTTTLSDTENTNLAGLKAGLFSTDAANTFAYCNIYATGTNGEYDRLEYLIGRDNQEPYYGLSWDQSTDTYIRTGLLSGLLLASSPGDSKLPIHSLMRRCVANDDGSINYFLDPNDYTKKEDGTASNLTGADGQVVVYIPKFYTGYMFGDLSANNHHWKISTSQLDGFAVHPAFMVNGVEVPYRLYGAYEGYKDGSNKLCSISGVLPTVSQTRATFRTYATNRGAGWGLEDAYLTAAVQLLYLIEYADFDTQSCIGNGITGYATWPNGPQALTGNSNTIGNATGNVSASVPKWAASTAKSLGAEIIPLTTQNGYTYRYTTAGTSGSTEPVFPTTLGATVTDGTAVLTCVRTLQYMSYRGIENWYGHIWKFADGINVNNVTGTGSQLYLCNTKANFANDTSTNYSLFGLLAQSSGYGKTLIQAANGFYPASVGGGTATYLADYFYTTYGTDGWRVALRGGVASHGTNAGAFYWDAGNDSSGASSGIGGRLCF